MEMLHGGPSTKATVSVKIAMKRRKKMVKCRNCGKEPEFWGFPYCKKCEKELGITYPNVDDDCWSNAVR
jgi:hypothetical protein